MANWPNTNKFIIRENHSPAEKAACGINFQADFFFLTTEQTRNERIQWPTIRQYLKSFWNNFSPPFPRYFPAILVLYFLLAPIEPIFTSNILFLLIVGKKFLSFFFSHCSIRLCFTWGGWLGGNRNFSHTTLRYLIKA